MKAIEDANAELRDVLPRGYQRMEKSTLTECLRLFAPLPRQLAGDAFGLIYEDFLSNFAASEGRLWGEFFTPYSIVRLIVEIIEPVSRARVFDPFMRNMGVSRDVQTGAAAVRQEIFGPLLSVTPDGLRTTRLVAIANNSIYGLSGEVTSADTERALRVAQRLRTGSVTVNGNTFFGITSPFGGTKQSGLDRRNGEQGFKEYPEIKTIGLPA
jgi:type I restriction enzyme M protein